ncbi:MAG: type II secretion system protein [Bacteroidetes bacterium]|nr:type II secretion system protein [Bacteroidota bacterium]
MQKLKAFTIVELVVVMIISAITLATIYTVYLLVKKQYLRQTEKVEQLNSYLQFKNTFSADFNRADSVKNNTEKKSVICYVDSSKISYEFSAKAIVRRYNAFTDSFLVFSYDPDVKTQENSELINYIAFKMVPYKDTVFWQLTKQYDANCLQKIKP